ncbi:MAG: PAS domain S-box protein, partial [Gemmataceae bacterium]|nr:PAS domain S-box protein [Gemmataceae bacterium]
VERRTEAEAEVLRRRVVEADLAETATTLRAFYDSAPLFMGVVEPTADGADVLHLYDNRASCRFLGAAPGRTANRRATDLGVPADTIRTWLGKYREAGGRNGPVGFDYRYDRADGAGWLSCTVSPVRAGPGGEPRFCYVAEDVTDRRRAEDALREREAEFRLLADNISQLAWMTDADGWIYWYNRRWFDYTGTTLDDMKGWGWKAVHHPDHVGRVVEKFSRHITAGTPWEDTFPLRGADGEYRWFLSRALPVRDESGKVVRWFGTNTDVTAQREAEADLREARAGLERRVAGRTAELSREREFLRAVLENIEDAVVACDADGRLNLFNRATLNLHGLPPQPIPADEWAGYYKLLHADGVTPMAAAEVPLYRALAGEHVRGAEMVVVPAAGGPPRALVASGQPIHDDAGRRLGAVVSMHDVTDRLAAEAARAEVIRQQTARDEVERSEARFRLLTEAVPQVVWNADPAGRVTYFNARWLEYTGLTVDDAADDGWLAAVHPDDRGRVGRVWRETVSTAAAGTDRRFSHELRLRKAGTDDYRWFLTVAVPLRRPGGAVDQWIGSMADVDDQKRAAEEVREREARFRALAEAVPQIVWVTRPDGYHEYYNPRWYEFTGVPDGSTDGEGWNAVFHPDDQPRAWARWKHSLETGENYEIEYRLRRRDGQYRWMLGLAQPQRDAAGRIVRWFGTCTDIHDAKQHEERLRQAADRFRSLTEAVPQMVWTADPAGTVTYFNRRWTEYTGFALADMAGDRAAGLIHPDDAAGLDRSWKAAVAGADGRYAREFRLRRQADGEYRWMLSNAVTLRDDAGAVAEWVGSLTDIDDQKRQAETLDRLVRERTAELLDQVEERRRAEDQVRAVARELQRSNRELEQFAYVASHDLQEPLRKIQAFGDLLGTKFAAQLPDQGREYVGKMQGSAGRMSRLIDDLLTFSRVTTHARPFARVDLNVILAEVLEDLEVRIERAGGVVDVGPLPAIDADPTQMRQLFQNLLGNALKFTHPGRPPAVTVRAESGAGGNGHPGGVCRFTVADNGIGFEDRYQERIFQVFQRLHGRDEYDGTGVGLAVCKKIVERHGGTITAHGRPGEGATFAVTLPARQPEPAAAPTAPVRD